MLAGSVLPSEAVLLCSAGEEVDAVGAEGARGEEGDVEEREDREGMQQVRRRMRPMLADCFVGGMV
jgi:hypothetical protein